MKKFKTKISKKTQKKINKMKKYIITLMTNSSLVNLKKAEEEYKIFSEEFGRDASLERWLDQKRVEVEYSTTDNKFIPDESADDFERILKESNINMVAAPSVSISLSM